MLPPSLASPSCIVFIIQVGAPTSSPYTGDTAIIRFFGEPRATPPPGPVENPREPRPSGGPAAELELHPSTGSRAEPTFGDRRGQKIEVGPIRNGISAVTMSYHQQGGPEGGRRQGPPYPLMGANGGAGGRAPAAGVYGMPQYGQVTFSWATLARLGSEFRLVEVDCGC